MTGTHSEGLQLEDVTLQKVLSLIMRTRRPLVVVFVIVSAFSAGVSLIMPKWYRSGAEFGIDTGPTASPTSGVLGIASQLGIAGLSGANSIPYYGEVLSSDQVLDRIALKPIAIDSAGTAATVYLLHGDPRSPLDRDRARKRLTKHFGWSVNARTNTIEFSVEAPTPDGARAAAETVLVALNQAIVDLRRTRATAERKFLEGRVDSATLIQSQVEDTLREFYLHNRLINTPNLQFTEMRLKRQVDFALQLTSQLRGQLEQARLQEVRDTPAVAVIAAPELPGERSSPNRKLIVVAAALATLLLELTWAIVSISMGRN